MTKIEIYETGTTVEIPSSWDEMTPRQVCDVMKIYTRCVESQSSPLEFNVRVLYYLMGMKHNARSVRWERLADADSVRQRDANIYMLCEKCLGFMFGTDDKAATLVYNSTRNVLPSVSRGWLRRRLVGPSDALQDLTFGEFRHASNALTAFFKSHDSSDLNECIAHLYRRKSSKANRAGRYVTPIDNSTFESDIRRAASLPSWQKTIIMLWFSACINFLQTGTVVLDGETVNLSALFSSDPDAKPTEFVNTWADLAINIAKEGTIGTMERIDEEPLYSIIKLMWHNHKENKRNEKIR